MAVTERQKIITKLYNENVADRLFDIVNWKRDGQSNSQIAERLKVHPIEFQEMVASEIPLQNALKKAEALIVDMLESTMVKVAKNGNVNAMKEVLAKLAPEKWGNKVENANTMGIPDINVNVIDASKPKEEIEALVKDLEDRIKAQQKDDGTA